jgi:glycosyltransferase involved in cell wall biosynthesis
MTKPLVSICIPTYNGAQYINKCIESCLQQTYTNFEIIICDDCSTDNTLTLIKEFTQKDNRIKFHQNTSNLGLVSNWNATLSYAQGEYIKWLFQDDWMEPNAIEEFVAAANKGFDFIISKRNFVLNDSATSEDKEYYNHQVKKLENHFPESQLGHYFSSVEISGFATDYIALNFIAEPSLIFFKKSLINKVGLYDKLFHQICDLEYNVRLAFEVGVYVINKPLCHFAIHANSTTNSNIHQKYFQLRFIEQAYYAYKLVNDVAFKSLQNHLTFSQKAKLKLYYKYRIHEAKRFISKQSDDSLYKNALINYPFLKQEIIDMVVLAPLFMSIDMLKSRN